MELKLCLLLGLACIVVQVVVVRGRDPELRISSPQKDIATPTGKDYVLMCEGVSDDVEGLFTNMRWTDPNGDIIEEGTPGVKQYDSNQLKLSFIKPTVDKTGYYNCSALYSNTINLQASVHVTFYGPPVFRENFVKISAEKGTYLEIYCTAMGDPAPDYIFYDNREHHVTATEGDVFVRQRENDNGITLVVSRVSKEHQGLYTCTAKNERGLVSKIFQITVVEPQGEQSDAIGSIILLDVTDHSALFHIIVSNPTSNTRNIMVQFQERFDLNASYIIWKSGDKQEIKNLTASGLYQFRFKVYPIGEWSDKFKLILLPQVPEIIIYSMSDGNLVLNLYQTTNDYIRNTIDKYLLSYLPIKEVELKGWVASECEILVEVPKCRFPGYKVAGLTMNTYYEVQIKVHTISGYGKPYVQRLQIT